MIKSQYCVTHSKNEHFWLFFLADMSNFTTGCPAQALVELPGSFLVHTHIFHCSIPQQIVKPYIVIICLDINFTSLVISHLITSTADIKKGRLLVSSPYMMLAACKKWAHFDIWFLRCTNISDLTTALVCLPPSHRVYRAQSLPA